ncbi:MAG: hypothetical protein ABSB42_07990 [Tepidisphaeraceae bacterium]|jgi:hypothetical protein
MPINVQCSCGKRMGLSDALAGKMIKCPACGDAIHVPAAAGPAAGKKPAAKPGGPAVYVSKGKIVALVSLVIVFILGIMFYRGPVRVWHQWEDVGPKAQADVTDVLTFGLQAYLSENGMYNPASPHAGPSVDSVSFFRPTLVMSMPEKVAFFGKSNQGDFKGYYHPASGEIEADVAYGGISFAGAVDLARATGKFHMTGRMANGFPQAEVNGTPIKIVWPEKDKE